MRNIRLILSLGALTLLSSPVTGKPGAVGPNGGWAAAWSPDSSTIAFTSGSPHSIPNLWVIGSDKKGLRQLTTRGAHDPVWLPDGKTIVFGTLRTGTPAYMQIDANGQPGSEKPVEALPQGADVPIWSPDGSLIAYAMVSKDGSSRDIGYVRANGGTPTGLTSKFWCRDWAWSPDGGTIAFSVGKAAGTSLWTVNLETNEIRLRYKGYCGSPVYSPDGKQLAISIPDVRSGFKLAVIDLAASVEKTITVTTFDGRSVMWSPDGKRLFFGAHMKSEPAVWSIGADGTGIKRLTAKAVPAVAAVLSPDGRKIAFQASKPNSYSPELYVCGDTGMKMTQIVGSSSPSYWSPVWSPGGKEFAFQSDVRHSIDLYTGTPAGRTSKPLSRIQSRDSAEVTWYPDGKTILLGDSGRLSSVKSTGGKNAATLLSKLALPVQGARIRGDEIVATEWVARDAVLSVLNLDGSKKRSLTVKVEEPAKPDDANAVDAPRAVAGAASADASEEGNPHADLGLVGPQVNVAKPERPATTDLWPAVSPDGISVAFSRNNQIWQVKVDGTGLSQLTSMASSSDAVRTLASPCWAPDGKTLLFTAFNSGPKDLAIEIWTSLLEPGSERLVHSEVVNTEYGVYLSDITNAPVFTPDGRRILFTSVATGEPRVVSIGLAGDDLREVVPAPSSYPALDATGTQLAYVDLSSFRERICVLDLTTGKRKGPLFRK